ncbi:LTA synthase family protein [Niallia nealsonii]|uniref:Glycerol phosphate lipoteichoic acid synthase n=1 Tax=Niallia nealsonii TaxID=115979 RepID=A0A2N0YYQ2_9BACI|nr:LTA synthase family protein [Niallia nealsonii]PKG22384.1 glycerol phosphate lipoteichoic acid synthase [Niallia nealsonii]
MKGTVKLWKKFIAQHSSFFLIAIILFWIKTYAAYKIEFSLGVEGAFQQFLLFINPISSALFFIGLALFIKGKAQPVMITVITGIMSFLLYANIVYYRFFTDFITVPVLMQVKVNGGQLSDSILSLVTPFDILYFLDVIVLVVLLATKVYKPVIQTNRRKAKSVFALAILTFIINLGLAEIDRPELLSRSFDRNYLVKYLGAYNFTVYDLVQNARSESQRALADSSDITEVQNYINANFSDPNAVYFGKAEGKNVIYISLESLQSFIINYKLEGKEVTPFLNKLTQDKNTFYFENFFHQTGQGKTSDAEFMMDNSLYGMSQGSVFVNKAQNTFQSAPAILKGKGYTTAAFHGNYKTFWNRNEMYKSLGYDYFFDAEYYDMSEENTKNYGMKDIPFFQESMPMLESLEKPFYTKFITLSNHHPFAMDEGDTDFPAGTTEDSVVNNYFQSAHYLDESIKQFFQYLKDAGLYDNTMIVMYGDHYGISENHNKAMAQVLNVDEITPLMNAQLQRVPLFIHAPGVEGKVVTEYGGDVDVMPTVLHLLGVNTKDYLQVGSDLLSNKHRETIPFRNGDFVSPTLTKLGDNCYNTNTGELVAGEDCKKQAESTAAELKASDSIVSKDLLRFYTPEGFTPINREDYNYIKDTATNEIKDTKTKEENTNQ